MPPYPVSLSAALNTTTLTTLHFTVRQDDRINMPEHSGSMLRGAFGTALRSLTCITDLPECKDCPLKQHCKFPRIFEMPALQLSTMQAVNPYVIHVPIVQPIPPRSTADRTRSGCPNHNVNNDLINSRLNETKPSMVYKKGDIWQFGMTIMGAAVAETGLIVNAWKLALATGLGTHAPYQKATLLQVSCEGDTLYSLPQLSQINAQDFPLLNQNGTSGSGVFDSQIASTDCPMQLTMQFLTPFRYQQNNRLISHPDNLDNSTFIASLYNRIRLCQDNHSPNQTWNIGYDSYYSFKKDIETLSITVDITANHVSRRSNRQQRKMQLYGLQGNIHLTGDRATLRRLLPALQLGEKLHIGKNTTMGLGQYQLQLTSINQPTYQG